MAALWFGFWLIFSHVVGLGVVVVGDNRASSENLLPKHVKLEEFLIQFAVS